MKHWILLAAVLKRQEENGQSQSHSLVFSHIGSDSLVTATIISRTNLYKIYPELKQNIFEKIKISKQLTHLVSVPGLFITQRYTRHK